MGKELAIGALEGGKEEPIHGGVPWAQKERKKTHMVLVSVLFGRLIFAVGIAV